MKDPGNLILVRPSTDFSNNTVPQNPANTPSLILINARSLVQRIDKLNLMLQTENIEIAAVTEFWFPESIDSNYFAIPNYNLQSKPRPNRRGGGVALYTSIDVQIRSLTDIFVPAELEVLWAWAHPPRLPRPLTGLILCVVYHPPASPHDLLLIEHISSTVDHLLAKYPGAGAAILGDFNKLDTNVICRLSGLKQVENIPTRCQATLDKIGPKPREQRRLIPRHQLFTRRFLLPLTTTSQPKQHQLTLMINPGFRLTSNHLSRIFNQPTIGVVLQCVDFCATKSSG